MPPEDPWTIGRLLNWTTEYFAKRNADSPRLDAEVLLAAVRGCKRIELYTAFEEPASEELRTKFREIVKRRSQGTPVAYLVGRREFYSLEFEVSPDVLIPRPETELLVVALGDHLKKAGREQAELLIADVGTGSGILAVCAARRCKAARVLAFDFSPAALTIAQRNAERHQVAERIEFFESDLLAAAPADAKFDVILSNPPYLTTEELAVADPDVRDYEPKLALDGGPEGTSVIERLLPQAADKLAPQGLLLMEVSPMIATRVEALVAGTAGLELLPTLKDLAHLPRVIQARATK